MCDYYIHIHSCTHTTSALGRLCNPAALIQTACKDKRIWQTIRVPEGCGECAVRGAVTPVLAMEKAKRGKLGVVVRGRRVSVRR